MASRVKPDKGLTGVVDGGVTTARRSREVTRQQRGRRAPAAPNQRRAGARHNPPSNQTTKPQHLREVGALCLFGMAVFLLFALLASEGAGIVGRGVQEGLVFAFGWLAYLAPVALLAVAARLVFAIRLKRSRLVGLGLFLFGLFLFVGAGAPPMGEHGEALFVRHLFERRAGGLGEALYAAVSRLAGSVGVSIVSWVALLSGFILLTGITSLWVGVRARQAAATVRAAARRGVLAKGRESIWLETRDEWPWAGNASAGGSDFPGDLASGDDRAGARRSGAVSGSGSQMFWALQGQTFPTTTKEKASGQSVFDDWLREGESTERYPGAHTDCHDAPRLIDGAQVFADLFVSPEQEALAGGKTQPKLTLVAEHSGAVDVHEQKPSAVGSKALDHEETTGECAIRRTAEQTGEHPEAEKVSEEQQVITGLEQARSGRPSKPERPVWVLPEPYMLRKSPGSSSGDGASQRERAAVLVNALAQFGVEARVVGMVVGPRVTRYELQLAPGTKVAKVSALKDDLAYALATTDIRILTPIPGKSAVGVEIPNLEAHWVTLGDIYQDFPRSAGPLMFWLGKDISGKPVYADLTRLPHLLIAGTTGSGKSGCVNCIVSSILLRATPDQVRMIMIDPKKVELSHYDRIPHLLVPVVTNMKDAAGVLHNVVKEMEDRYELMELDHARNLPELNKARARRAERPLPYILIVIDELADLMMTSPQEVEDYVIRIAQKARAVGIHLVVATQRPSADVITGMIKANIPSRIAFAVSSQVDSRVILDANGAETLLGAGDMLFKPLGSSHMQRVQGALITEEEIAILVAHWRRQAEPEFREELLRRPEGECKRDEEIFDPDADDLLPEAARLVIETGNASVSMLQRRLRVGYTRAGRLIDMLERRGIVGPWEGSKPRQILVLPEEVDQVIARLEAEQKAPAGRDLH